MKPPEGQLSTQEIELARLLRAAVWMQVCLVVIVTFAFTLLARAAETFILRIKADQLEIPMLPPLSRVFFDLMPNTLLGVSTVAVLCGGLSWVLLYSSLRRSSPSVCGLAKCHILALLFSGIFGFGLILASLCTLLPLIPWP